MWIYLILFFIPLIAYWNSRHETGTAKNNLFLGLYMTLLAVFVGISDMLGGYDRYIYGNIFDSISRDINDDIPISEISSMYFFEVGYSYINWFLAHITGNRYIFIFIYTILIYINLYIAFKRHIQNYPFAFLVFLGLLFFFTFTYLRQVYGVSLALLSIKYLLERKRIGFFLIMIAVALIHKSGIIFALMFFIPIKKIPRMYVIFILFLCLGLGLSGFTSNIYDAYIEISNITAQGHNYSNETGTRIAYAVEVVIFASIILANYEIIGRNKEEIIFLNMALMFCAILLLFIRSENGGRLTWYFIFGIIYTMTKIIENIQREQLLRVILIVLFFGLFLRILITWDYLLYPYKTFFSPGHREGDLVYEYYEYDTDYDYDKLKNAWTWQ